MKDVTELTVTETRLFKSDVIPFSTLITASNIQTISSSFIFRTIELVEDENRNVAAIHMKTGEFRHIDKIFPIEILIIEPRRIIFKIKGDSDIAERFYQAIFQSLSKIDPHGQFKQSKPLIKSTETSCIVTLDFLYRDIFSKKMNDFIDKKAYNACSTEISSIADIQILPKNLAFSVHYDLKDKSLRENNVMISPKSLIIEPRVGVSLKEKRFFTASPTDSNTHLKLISELEKSFRSEVK